MLPFLYNLFFPLAFVVLLPGYLRRMVRRGNYRRNFTQRFGWYSAAVRARLAALRGAVWVEAVSVGEMLVALKLIAALRQAEPTLSLVVSTTTTTGFALAKERVPPGVEVIYTPIDLRGAVRRTFEVVQPCQLVIVDGGLWPNQLWEAQRREVPTALVNARLSPRSERRFRRFSRVAKSLFQALNFVGVTEPEDVERWASLGVAPKNVQWTGSIKQDDEAFSASSLISSSPAASRLDATQQDVLRQLGVNAGAPVLLAASTHPGEERLIGEVFQKLRAQHTGLFLIVAPRHVERTPEVAAELQTIGLRMALRTTLPRREPGRLDGFILNTTGELRAWYPAATLAFIGKSLCAVGGQNPGEAVQAGVPVLFGPHMENFADLVPRLLSAEAAVQVSDALDLAAHCLRLLNDPKAREEMAAAAQQIIAVHHGAARRTVEKLADQRQKSACQER